MNGNIQFEGIHFTKENGIIKGVYFKDVIITLEMAKVAVKNRKIISDYEILPMLIDGTQVKKINKEARDYFASEEGSELLSATALLIDSNFTSFIANFLLKITFKKSRIPIQVFSNKQDAIKWLKTYNENGDS